MKKFLAILLAMTLCLCSFAAVAEQAAATEAPAAEDAAEGDDTAEVTSIELPMSYEGQEIAIGDTGLTLTIPADWVAVDAPEGALLAYQAADGSLAMTLNVTDLTLDSVWDTCTQQVTDGTGKELHEAEINGIYYILYDAADGVTSAAYTSISDTETLVVAFVSATADSTSSIPGEIVGSLAGFEDDGTETETTDAQ